MDLGETGNLVAQGVFGAIGGYYFGYRGMMIGMSVASLLFHADEAKEHQRDSEQSKPTAIISKPDVVPMLIGTDRCPGNVIWIDDDVPAIVDPRHYNNPVLNDFENEYEQEAQDAGQDLDIEWLHIEFFTSFNDGSKINRVFLDNLHHWLWLRLDDFLHTEYGWSESGWVPITTLEYNYLAYPWNYTYSVENFTPIKSVAAMYWWGAMLVPMSVAMAVETHADTDYNDFVAISAMPQQMPDLKAEGSKGSLYTPYASGTSSYRFTGYSHSYRDNLFDYFYGVLDSDDYGEPWYNIYCSIRKCLFYEYTYTKLVEDDYSYYNITKGYTESQSYSRQDIDGNPDHLYIVHCRNWDKYWLDYNNHHAPYSLEYDIFYIDRSDDSVHSIIYDERIIIEGEHIASNAIPSVKIGSMEIANDSILLFGYENQSYFIWDDFFELTADAVRSSTTESAYYSHRKTVIYADFSLYPDNYWVDDAGDIWVWAYFSSYYYDVQERYRVVEQTSTYIAVDGWFAILPVTGKIVHLDRRREKQASWGIVGEGSTRERIVTSYYAPFEPRISSYEYDSVQFYPHSQGKYMKWGWEIASHDSNSVTLSTPLPEDPVPGDIIWFSYDYYYQGRAWPYLTPLELYDENSPFYRFYNPVDYWFTDYIFERLENAAPLGTGPLPEYWYPPRYFTVGLQNSTGFLKHVILKFSKSTGEFQGKIYEWKAPIYNYVGIQKICVIETFQVVSAATDAQIAVSFHNIQPYVTTHNFQIVIDKSNLNILSQSIEWHSLLISNVSHACGKDYVGCVKVRAWDRRTGIYSYRWYALVIEFSPIEGNFFDDSVTAEYDNSNLGYYIVDLGEDGIFPEANHIFSSEEGPISSILNCEANSEGMVKWFRQNIITGPMYSTFFHGPQYGTRRESPQLRIYDYDEKMIFHVQRNSYAGYPSETWCYKMPDELNKYGFSWPMSASEKSWGLYTGSYMYSMFSNKYYVQFNSNNDPDYSNYCDDTIGGALGLITDLVSSSIYIDSNTIDYCFGIVDDVVIYLGKVLPIKEPRFLFSYCYSEKKPIIDMIKDVLATCQGMLITNCKPGYKMGQFKVPNPNEAVIWYLGIDQQSFVSTLDAEAVDDDYVPRTAIYCDLSGYPDDYWKGDQGVLIRGISRYEFDVKNSYSDHIVLVSAIDTYSLPNDEVYLKKDNMKEGSFVYSKKPQREKSNRVRIEFINRLLEYKIDVAEADDHYKQDIVDQRVILRQLELHGIKRATQAGRMALRYLDYEQFVDWMCKFETDFLGSYFCVGDIIGITHPVTGWTGKLFRVINKEEQDDHEVIVECEEYLPSIYHDYSNPVYQGGGGSGNRLPYSTMVDPVIRLYAYYDFLNNRVYVAFNTPEFSNTVGANIYYSVNGGSYTYAGLGVNSTASVYYSSTGTEEASSLEPTRTIYNELNDANYQYVDIPYDPTTMMGTFPASGYIWINGELIYYNSIDTINNMFMGCVRGIEVPEYQYAADAPDDGYNWTNPLITLADMSSVFHFQLDSISLDLTDEALQTEGSQIEYNIPTITIRAAAINVLNNPAATFNSPSYTIQLRYPMGRPYSPTLLRYYRDI